MRLVSYLIRRLQGYSAARSIRYAEDHYRTGDTAVGVVIVVVMAAYLITDLIDLLY